jgi:hypothetical protein
MSHLETILTTTPVAQWRVHQVIVFDWSDGPREGFCELEHPHLCFHFKLLAEPCASSEHGDSLFRICTLPVDAVQQTLVALTPLGEPTNPVWIPRWRFPDSVVQAAAEQVIDRFISHRQPSSLIIQTTNMTHFLGCWAAVR